MRVRRAFVLAVALFVLVVPVSFAAATDPFITDWDLSKPGSGPNQITFTAFSSGVVSYSWTTLPAGANSGSGTFDGGSGTYITISGFPASATIRLFIDTSHFQSIQCGVANDERRLINIYQWGTTVWKSMNNAFSNCSNLQIAANDLPDLSKATTLNNMFYSCISLNTPTNINYWNLSNVTDLSYMFSGDSAFNQNIGNWNTSNVTNMSGMFYGSTSFNQNIRNWNVSKVTNMNEMFDGATSFNQDISSWNVSKVTEMAYMFGKATSFNQDIGNWKTSNVTDMSYMFYRATSFNQSIGKWDVSNVQYMTGMLAYATSFNQNIGNWNVSNVIDMSNMFFIATSFNQNIQNWNISNVVYMTGMLAYATSFNQNLASWAYKLNSSINLRVFLSYCGMSVANYDSTLLAFNTSAPTGLTMGASGLKYCNAVSARNNLTKNKDWTITGDTLFCSATGLSPSSKNISSPLFSIYPNPAQDWVTIDLANNQEGQVEISNELGQVVNTKKLTDQENISLSGLKPGVYSFKINQGNNVQYLRVVKQ